MAENEAPEFDSTHPAEEPAPVVEPEGEPEPVVAEDEPAESVKDDEGTVINHPDAEGIKRSVEEQRKAAEEGRAPDPSISGWDSANQIPVSPGANPENYLRSPGEVREAGDA